MKRWHDDYHITLREWKKHRRIHVQSNLDWAREPGKDPFIVECACDDQVGRFRKKDAYDCGISRCLICHGDKFPKRFTTYQEWCADLKLKEGIEELA